MKSLNRLMRILMLVFFALLASLGAAGPISMNRKETLQDNETRTEWVEEKSSEVDAESTSTFQFRQ